VRKSVAVIDNLLTRKEDSYLCLNYAENSKSDDRYPQDIKFEVVKDKISQLDSVQVGQDVAVSFDLRGNEYNGKYYVNLNAWRIQAAQGGATSAQSTPQQQAATPAQSASPASSGPAFEAEPSSNDLNGSFDDEDIPF